MEDGPQLSQNLQSNIFRNELDSDNEDSYSERGKRYLNIPQLLSVMLLYSFFEKTFAKYLKEETK